MSTDGMAIAADLERLLGHSFDVENLTSGHATFTFPNAWPPGWPRRGGEGYVFPVNCTTSSGQVIPSIMKTFFVIAPERETRTKFLVEGGLTKDHEWMFHGVPYSWLGGIEINGIQLYAHVTPQIGAGSDADDYGRLRQNDAAFSSEDRNILATHLIDAVEELESRGITHGDLSPGNMLITRRSGGTQTATLIDYDGFSHASVKKLPRLVAGQPCRMIGTAGYQYPELISRSQQDQDVSVDTDRFALGVLVCELIALDGTGLQALHAAGHMRYGLLDDQLILSGELTKLPQQILDVFPEGFNLLERALNAGSIGSLPSPAEWRQALSPKPKPFTAVPLVTVKRMRGQNQYLVGRANLKSNDGSLKAIDERLAGVSFSKDPEGVLHVDFQWRERVVRSKRDGKTVTLHAEDNADILVAPGDTLVSNGWRFEFEEQ